MKKIVVIGQGYVGLPLAVAFANSGHEVLGLDKSAELVARLKSGESHVEDVPDEVLQKVLKDGTYSVTTDESALASCDVAIIAVPTPLDENRQPDISYVESAAQAIGENIKNPILVINESTSYPGTLRNVIAKKIVLASGLAECDFAISPERVDPGNTNWRISNTPRLIAGVTDSATKAAKDLYQTICKEIVVVASPEVAELAKLFENTFRQVNIALVNELALITQSMGISINAVLEAASTKPYGFMKFNPGLGVGGHCIPVDPSYLAFSAIKNGIEPRFINLANEINLNMPHEVIKRLKHDFNNSLSGKRILICGLSYKEGISDLRESPSIKLMQFLRDEGVTTLWYDPLVSDFNNEVSHEPENLEFDATVVAQLHPQMDLEKITNSSQYIFDCKGRIPNARSF